MKKRFLYSLALTVVMITAGMNACVDYNMDNAYYVDNQLKQPVKIYFEVLPDSVRTIILEASTADLIFVDSDLCERNYFPPKTDLPFKKFEVYYQDSIKIGSDLNNQSLWHFANRKYKSTYLLVVDSVLIR